MKVLYKSPGNKFTVEFTGETQKDVFEQVGDFQSVFEGNDSCGFHLGPDEVCGADTYFNTREVDGNKYYSKRCIDCGAELTFHQNKKGGSLFLKVDDKWNRWINKDKNDKNDDTEVFDDKKTPAKKGK